MTLPALIRVFFAIDLPTEVKEHLDDFIALLKKKSKSHAIRWTKPSNLHITLQFLAEIQKDHLTQLIESVRFNMLQRKPQPILLKFGELQLFPNPYRPRVIVLETHPQEKLEQLATSIGLGIKDIHYEIDSRPFRGHLTLGRIKHTQGIQLNFLTEVNPPILTQPIIINEVTLFRSEPQADGSKYTVLDSIELE